MPAGRGVVYPSQGHEMLFDAHARGFAALGVARRGIYDNMKTAVDKVDRGRARAVNDRSSAMCAHYLFEPDFCNVASGWEKGIVEKTVQDSRRRVWQEATRLRWGSLEELNAWLGQRCRQFVAGAAPTDRRQARDQLHAACLVVIPWLYHSSDRHERALQLPLAKEHWAPHRTRIRVGARSRFVLRIIKALAYRKPTELDGRFFLQSSWAPPDLCDANC